MGMRREERYKQRWGWLEEWGVGRGMKRWGEEGGVEGGVLLGDVVVSGAEVSGERGGKRKREEGGDAEGAVGRLCVWGVNM